MSIIITAALAPAKHASLWLAASANGDDSFATAGVLKYLLSQRFVLHNLVPVEAAHPCEPEARLVGVAVVVRGVGLAVRHHPDMQKKRRADGPLPYLFKKEREGTS